MTDTDKTVRCPYMAEHVMHVDSLLTHLIRCKATNKHLFKNCLYNSLHVVLKQNYKQHIRTCEDRFKKGDTEEEQWQGRNRPPIDRSIHRTNTDFSSSGDGESIVVSSNDEYWHENYENQNYQRSFNEDKLRKEMISHYSFVSFQSQPRKNRQNKFMSEESKEGNQYFDFSFRKDHKPLSEQKFRTGTVQSERETCESNRSGLELTSEEKSDDDEVLELIQVIEGKAKNAAIQGRICNKFIDGGMMKGEKKNKFFDQSLDHTENNVC